MPSFRHFYIGELRPGGSLNELSGLLETQLKATDVYVGEVSKEAIQRTRCPHPRCAVSCRNICRTRQPMEDPPEERDLSIFPVEGNAQASTQTQDVPSATNYLYDAIEVVVDSPNPIGILSHFRFATALTISLPLMSPGL